MPYEISLRNILWKIIMAPWTMVDTILILAATIELLRSWQTVRLAFIYTMIRALLSQLLASEAVKSIHLKYGGQYLGVSQRDCWSNQCPIIEDSKNNDYDEETIQEYPSLNETQGEPKTVVSFTIASVMRGNRNCKQNIKKNWRLYAL